jgi:hypothetical protein
MMIDPNGEKMKWWQWLLIGIGADIVTGGLISSTLIAKAVGAVLPTNHISYELEKQISPVAFKIGLNFGSDGWSFGFDISAGVPYSLSPVAYRHNVGASYGEANLLKGYFKGWETRQGAEFVVLHGFAGISGTNFGGDFPNQTLNKIWLGGISYENDYMFNFPANKLGVPKADGGDRWRTAAIEVKFGAMSLNLNMFTGDPDTYTIGDRKEAGNYYWDDVLERYVYSGGTANKYRAGVLSFNFGFFRIGGNSEQVRKVFQNQFAHDFLMGGNSYWFEVLNINSRYYWYFGSSSGNSLW